MIVDSVHLLFIYWPHDLHGLEDSFNFGNPSYFGHFDLYDFRSCLRYRIVIYQPHRDTETITSECDVKLALEGLWGDYILLFLLVPNGIVLLPYYSGSCKLIKDGKYLHRLLTSGNRIEK